MARVSHCLVKERASKNTILQILDRLQQVINTRVYAADRAAYLGAPLKRAPTEAQKDC